MLANNAGIREFNAGNLDGALYYFRQALARFPRNREFRFNVASLLHRIAEREFGAADRRNEASLVRVERMLAEAEGIFRRGLEQHSRSLRNRINNLRAARLAEQRSIDALVEQANAAIRRGETERALGLLREARAVRPGDPYLRANVLRLELHMALASARTSLAQGRPDRVAFAGQAAFLMLQAGPELDVVPDIARLRAQARELRVIADQMPSAYATVVRTNPGSRTAEATAAANTASPGYVGGSGRALDQLTDMGTGRRTAGDVFQGRTDRVIASGDFQLPPITGMPVLTAAERTRLSGNRTFANAVQRLHRATEDAVFAERAEANLRIRQQSSRNSQETQLLQTEIARAVQETQRTASARRIAENELVDVVIRLRPIVMEEAELGRRVGQ